MKAPERIYGWLHSQLSIARFGGGIRYNGHEYVIAINEKDQPLVRLDVLKREAAEKKNETNTRNQNKTQQAPLAL